MPQLDLYGAPAAHTVTWTYDLDPIRPEKAPRFSVILHRAGVGIVEHGLVTVPNNVIHEEVDDLLRQSWMAYLFGEPGDVRAVIATRHRAWRDESDQRPRL